MCRDHAARCVHRGPASLVCGWGAGACRSRRAPTVYGSRGPTPGRPDARRGDRERRGPAADRPSQRAFARCLSHVARRGRALAKGGGTQLLHDRGLEQPSRGRDDRDATTRRVTSQSTPSPRGAARHARRRPEGETEATSSARRRAIFGTAATVAPPCSLPASACRWHRSAGCWREHGHSAAHHRDHALLADRGPERALLRRRRARGAGGQRGERHRHRDGGDGDAALRPAAGARHPSAAVPRAAWTQSLCECT